MGIVINIVLVSAIYFGIGAWVYFEFVDRYRAEDMDELEKIAYDTGETPGQIYFLLYVLVSFLWPYYLLTGVISKWNSQKH